MFKKGSVLRPFLQSGQGKSQSPHRARQNSGNDSRWASQLNLNQEPRRDSFNNGDRFPMRNNEYLSDTNDMGRMNSCRRVHADFISFLYGDHGQSYDEYVGSMEATLTFPREKIAYGLMGLLAVYLIIGTFAQLICNLVGFAYPAYVSVKAVRTKKKSDDTQWLIYWCVFAVFSLVDFFASGIMRLFPFYWLFKMIFLIYLYLPQTQGANYIFFEFVNPLVTKIDKWIEKNHRW
ncbi:TB2/DP1, HVA22 family [Dictyocaulus viviparus]|uniref:Receptor expression-enhancing protein n=1 Tax=Dictyocaulus viviparus TaxID=29172 RepID=A0A0D8XCP3_DICVI|nr:TB2/DP1, HVA22 family [Dictyocaulus viviparus]